MLIVKYWWKSLGILLLALSIYFGLMMPVPARPILNETIRNYFFHVPMWVTMLTFFVISLINAFKFLNDPQVIYDIRSTQYAKTGLLFGVIGLLTGMLWANYTWGKFWSNDPKQIGTVIGLLSYFAYFILRDSLVDIDKKRRLSAVYNIFAFSILIPCIIILPRLVDSLHPGGKGNPLINPKDIDLKMFIVFWSTSAPGWILIGLWMVTLQIRIYKLKESRYL
jgi:heme exporter protein C